VVVPLLASSSRSEAKRSPADRESSGLTITLRDQLFELGPPRFNAASHSGDERGSSAHRRIEQLVEEWGQRWS
jgi:hypothetical protein